MTQVLHVMWATGGSACFMYRVPDAYSQHMLTDFGANVV